MAMAKVASTKTTRPTMAPWYKAKAASDMAESEGPVVTREDFLARMPVRPSSDQVHKLASEQVDKLLAHLAPLIQKPAAPCAPPPGLGHIAPPPGLTLPTPPSTPVAHQPRLRAMTAPEPVVESQEPEAPKDFQVLLRNLPEVMCKAPMIRVMLEQASLDDECVSIETRPGGKALVAFSSLNFACQCMRHFNGRQWGKSEPVTALYVRKVDNTKTDSRPRAESLNVAAPAFVPGKCASLSANAAVFNPNLMMTNKMKNERDRFFSDASTAITTSGEASENSEPEAEELTA